MKLKNRWSLSLWALSMTLLFALAGCGGGGGNSSSTATKSTAAGTISAAGGDSGATLLSMAAPSGVALSVQPNTVFTDASGNTVSGTLATNVGYSTSAADLPAAAATLPAGASLVSFADVTVSGQSAQVKHFSKPVSLAFAVPASVAKTGDALTVYSFDSGTGAWSFAGTEIVDANGKLTTGISHLSIWALFKSATPPPVKPSGLTATAGDGQVTLSWSAVSAATSYNIYYGTTAGVSSATATKIAGATSGQAVTGLSNGTTYYFAVTAVSAAGESVLSGEVSAIPVPPAPAKPAGITPSAGDGQVTLVWNAATGATSYNVYWGTTAGVTTASPNKITGITALSQVVPNLTNGTTYYFVVTAVNAGGESTVSSEKSATPAAAPQPPGNPTGVNATAGTGQVTVTFAYVANATSYNVHYLQASGSAPSTAEVIASPTLVSSTSSPVTVTGLTSGANYYFTVTAVNGAGESGGQTTPKKATPL